MISIDTYKVYVVLNLENYVIFWDMDKRTTDYQKLTKIKSHWIISTLQIDILNLLYIIENDIFYIV